jgi:hypothetical protein
MAHPPPDGRSRRGAARSATPSGRARAPGRGKGATSGGTLASKLEPRSRWRSSGSWKSSGGSAAIWLRAATSSSSARSCARAAGRVVRRFADTSREVRDEA